jgi:4-carboxymuconolactone decarboxylase
MQNEISPRIEPILPSAWDDTMIDALGAFPKSLNFVKDKWDAGERQIRGMNVLGTMAHHPALAKAFMTFNAHVSGNSTLSVRTRELVILRLSWLRKADYEYLQHIILGRRAGLTDEEISRMEQGPEAPGWSAEDADLLRATDDLCAHARITKATWTRLAATFNTQQMLDLVFVIGCYEVLAMAMNSFNAQLEVEPGTEELVAEVKARILPAR